MSKTRIGITVVVLATLLSSAAMARARFGIGPLGVATFAVTRVLSLGGLHHARGPARHGQIRTVSVRSQDVRSFMDSGLGNPAVRRQIVASAALAGWHGGRTANAWWRHGDGGYGWVGPLYWPFAIYDIHDYTIWGDGIGASGTTAILTSMPRSLCLTAHEGARRLCGTGPARPKISQGPSAAAALQR